MHIDPIFLNLSLILVVAGVTTLIFKYLKQPLVLGYIVAGFLTGPHFVFFPTVLDSQTITVWGEIGVIFLLFALGLEFSIKKIKKVGGTGATTAVTEALIMMSVGLIAGRLMGWSTMNSLFLGGMLSISSTSIIVKAFDDLKLKNRRFSQIVIGVLVFEDLVAILLLVLLSTIAVSKQFDGTEMLLEMGKLLMFLVLWFTAGIYVIPTMLRKLKRFMNDETLLIVSVGLCLGMVVVAAKSGFSPALGAFLMGTIMAETDESESIHRLITPLRNLFAAVFFISVGMLVDPVILVKYMFPIAIITLIVLFIKPLSATFGIMLSGHTMKQSMQAGFCLSQIGEFSFIIATLGLSLKVIDAYLYPVIVSVSIITIFATPYLMKLAEPLYDRIYKLAPAGWRIVIQEYGTGSRTLNRDSDWRLLLRSYLSRMLIYSGWLVAVIVLSFNIIIPFANKTFENTELIELLGTIFTLMLMSPFLYALMIKRISRDMFDRLWMDRKYARGPLLTLRLARFIIGALFIGFVLGHYFTLKLAILIPAIVGIVVIISMSRRLKSYYFNMEQQFLSNLDKTSKRSGIAIPGRLSNDIHMEYVDVMVYSGISGMSIRDTHRKYHTGAQVICIQRRDKRIDLPQNTEVLQAGDRLLIVGTDQQIQDFRNNTESPADWSHAVSHDSELDLYQVTISEESPLCGEQAHVSELRNKYEFLLIGYERGMDGFKRPRTEVILAAGDTLWLVGAKRNLNNIY